MDWAKAKEVKSTAGNYPVEIVYDTGAEDEFAVAIIEDAEGKRRLENSLEREHAQASWVSADTRATSLVRVTRMDGASSSGRYRGKGSE